MGGRRYAMATDFCVALAYLRLQESDEAEDDKAAFGLSLFLGDQIAPADLAELVDQLRWYLRCGKPEDGGMPSPGPRTFDMLVDSGRIFAAFLQVYGLNLRRVRMHWWVFCELLEGLPRVTRLSEVMEIRGKKIEQWMGQEQRADLARLKMHYRIERATEADFSSLFDSL